MATKITRSMNRHSRHARRCAFSAFVCRDCGRSLKRQTHLKVNLCSGCLSRSASTVLHHAQQ